MGCQSIAGLPPALSSPVPIYTPGWRGAQWELSVLPKNTTQCHRSGLEPGPLNPETSALTMKPPRLPHFCSAIDKRKLKRIQERALHVVLLDKQSSYPSLAPGLDPLLAWIYSGTAHCNWPAFIMNILMTHVCKSLSALSQFLQSISGS